MSRTVWEPRRIGIIGAGAMGTSLAAFVGNQIPTVMVCRNPARASELFERGALVQGLVDANARPIVVRSIADLERVGGVSVLFVATKTTAIPEVAAELGPLLEKISDHPAGPIVVSFQNGIDPGRQLIELLKYQRVLRIVLNFAGSMDELTGCVQSTLIAPPSFIGGADGQLQVEANQIATVLTQAGFETKADPSIERRVWIKGVINAAFNPVAALVNSTVGQLLSSPAKEISTRLLHEGQAVAQAEGLDFGDDFMDQAFGLVEKALSHTPSMVYDIRQGRESEVGQLNRQIIDHGKRLGVLTPTHEIVDALIETFDWKVYAKLQLPPA